MCNFLSHALCTLDWSFTAGGPIRQITLTSSTETTDQRYEAKEGTVVEEGSRECASCRKVFGAMPSQMDFPPSLSCKVLQKGDETSASGRFQTPSCSCLGILVQPNCPKERSRRRKLRVTKAGPLQRISCVACSALPSTGGEGECQKSLLCFSYL